jgi:uridine kinase
MTNSPQRSLTSLIAECRPPTALPRTRIVGIDGVAGAGKGQLAAAMQSIDSSIGVIHMDDFHRGLEPVTPSPVSDEVGAQIDWRRVIEEVVTPLYHGNPGRYRPFDWDSQSLGDEVIVPSASLVLLEGVYATRKEIAGLLDLRIWVETPLDVAIERAIARDGEASREWLFTHWLADQQRYLDEHRPEATADIVIDGAIGEQLYPGGQYARVRALR